MSGVTNIGEKTVDGPLPSTLDDSAAEAMGPLGSVAADQTIDTSLVSGPDSTEATLDGPPPSDAPTADVTSEPNSATISEDATIDGPMPSEPIDDSPTQPPAPIPSAPIPTDSSATLLDVPPEVLKAAVEANERAKKSTSALHERKAETESRPSAVSETPTLRPPPKVSAHPFAGLLAEADPNRSKKGIGALKSTVPKSTISKSTSSKSTVSKSDTQVDPHDTIDVWRKKKRKNQRTLNIEGRGRSDAVVAAETAGDSEQRIGSYRVLGELGSGGMAVVYKAVQPALDRLVAIKELRPDLAHDKQIVARFEREATSLATLQHGNIVHIYDFVRDFDSTYIVMEYVEGVDLFDVLAQTTRLPSDVGAVVALQIAEALEYAHYRGIIHRDIKPSNVLISKLGEVKLMDFGIARDPGRANITQIGMALGTPAYMAPEQIRGDQIDFRADLFSFGICLFEMLCGEKPWPDEGGQSVARKILFEQPRQIREFNPDVPAALEAVIARCLNKEPAQRYATTYDLRRDLESYVAREVHIDPRQRSVVFLRNRKLITEGEASSFVGATALTDGELKRRDQGLGSPPAEALLRRVLIACAIALAGVFLAAAVAALVPFGQRLASGPQRLVPASSVASDADDDATQPAKKRKATTSKKRRARRAQDK